MMILRQSFVLSTLLVSVLSSPTLQGQQGQQDQEDQQQQQPQLTQPPPPRHPNSQSFQHLLADVDESSIHSALHVWSSKFQDGVFSRDRTALEAVHSENAPLATSLLHLAKRQESNNTASASPSPIVTSEPDSPSPASSSPPEEESQSEIQSPTPAPSSSPPEGDSQSDVPSPAPAPATSDGVIQPVSSRTTATRAPSTAAVPVSTPPSATPVATSDGRVVFSVSDSPDSPDATGRLTTIDASSQVVSFEPSSSTILSTLTLPDGSVSTQTSVTVVDAAVTGGGVGAPSPTSGSGGPGDPSLQSVASATRSYWKEVVAVVGGAVVMGLAM